MKVAGIAAAVLSITSVALACFIPPRSVIRDPQLGVSARAVLGDPVYDERLGNYRIGDRIFRQQLVYLGRSGTTLTLGYREFSDDYARPAFSENLTYDGSTGLPMDISFRSVRLRVFGADNNTIEYVVESGFNELLPPPSRPESPVEKSVHSVPQEPGVRDDSCRAIWCF